MSKYNGNAGDVFKSKRFWSLLLGLAFMLASALVPDLEAHSDQLINAALVLVAVIIGGYSAQDAVSAVYDRGAVEPTTKEPPAPML